jgi:serine/threonine protein kinase
VRFVPILAFVSNMLNCGARSDMKAIKESLPDVVAARYEIVSTLGTGSFSEVYRANDTMLDRAVAIKRIRLNDLADRTERDEVRARFVREAKLAAKLKHANVVTIYDFVDTSTMSFIIMELVEGSTLHELRKKNTRFSLEETIDILTQVADAVDYAHRLGVIHRDIKPANILIESSGCVKVTDFGIAKSCASSNITTTGTILGTPNYMSPEQARGDLDLDGRSDVFSLGCVLYECLSGEKPFRSDSAVGTLMQVVNGNIPTLDPRSLGVHVDIQKVLNRALAANPSRRYGSGEEMIQALKSLSALESKAGLCETVVLAARPVVTRRQSGTEPRFDDTLMGALGETTLVEVIRDINEHEKTGILHLERNCVRKRIYFKRGSIVFANSDLIEDRLDEHLKRTGTIEESAIELASRLMFHNGNRLGKTLIELGYLDTETMEAKVAQQVEVIIDSLLDWKSGDYRFEFLDEPVEEDITVKVSTADTILKGVRRLESSETIRNGLRDLDRILHRSADALLLFPRVSLTPEEGYVLSRIDGSTSVSEAVAISPLGNEKTLRCIYGLVYAGMAELKDKNNGDDGKRDSKATREEVDARGDALLENASISTAGPSVSGSSSPDERAEALYAVGLHFFRRMAYFDAIQYFKEVVRLCPNESRYHKVLAEALSQNPHWVKQAEEHFRLAREIDPLGFVNPSQQERVYDAFDLMVQSHEAHEEVLEPDPEKRDDLRQSAYKGKVRT